MNSLPSKNKIVVWLFAVVSVFFVTLSVFFDYRPTQTYLQIFEESLLLILPTSILAILVIYYKNNF
mgnify:CR=1 FL=1